jgi:hypothetical protein
MESLRRTGHVTVERECLLWNGALAGKGYPVASDDRERYVHRLVLLLDGRPLQKGEQAAHSCGHSRCINPLHLRGADQADNEADKRSHGTYNHGWPGVTHCGRYLSDGGRCKRLPHDGPCKPDIFEATYEFLDFAAGRDS